MSKNDTDYTKLQNVVSSSRLTLNFDHFNYIPVYWSSDQVMNNPKLNKLSLRVSYVCMYFINIHPATTGHGRLKPLTVLEMRFHCINKSVQINLKEWLMWIFFSIYLATLDIGFKDFCI